VVVLSVLLVLLLGRGVVDRGVRLVVVVVVVLSVLLVVIRRILHHLCTRPQLRVPLHFVPRTSLRSSPARACLYPHYYALP